MQTDTEQYSNFLLRIPSDLLATIRLEADRERRSITSQIVYWLEAAVREKEKP